MGSRFGKQLHSRALSSIASHVSLHPNSGSSSHLSGKKIWFVGMIIYNLRLLTELCSRR